MAKEPKSMEDLRLLRLQLAGYEEALGKTLEGELLRNARVLEMQYVRQVGKNRDLSEIVELEKEIVRTDLARLGPKNSDLRNSLENGLEQLVQIEKNIDKVKNPESYREVDENHRLRGNRKAGLPYDEARQAFASHPTRLDNLKKAPLTLEQLATLDARKHNMKVGESIYVEMQTKTLKALGIELPSSKARGTIKDRGGESI